MAMWRSVILAPLTPLLFSVILTDLHLLVVLVLEGTGLHQMGPSATNGMASWVKIAHQQAQRS